MAEEDPIRDRNQQQAPTVRELAIVLFRQRRVFLWISSLVFAAAICYAIFGTQYQANMKVLVRRGRADAPVSTGVNAPLDLTHLAVTEEELNSEVELLRDGDVLRTVAQQTGVRGHDWLRFLQSGEGRDQEVERAARRLAKRLKVEPVKKTNLIAISYSSEDPQKAAKVLQCLANVYLAKHTDVHRPGGERPFFMQQAEESRRQLEEAKQELWSFGAKNGVVAAALQRDLTLQRLSEIDASHTQTKIALAETQQRVVELRKQLEALPERSTTQVRTADNPELLKELKSSLLNLELKRTQLLTKFEPNHRLVQEVEKQIELTKSAIADEHLAPLRDETTDKNGRYEWAQSELQQAEVQLQTLRARDLAASSEEAFYKESARKFGQETVTQEDLLGNEKAALENYLLYVKKQEEARMNDALDERGIVNVAIAEQPVVPALPRWSAWTVVVVGFIASGIAGTGASFMADYLTTSFRDPDDVVTYLDAPVLASLPKVGPRRVSA
jgi:polysaccharide biosynthesis protein PslE